MVEQRRLNLAEVGQMFLEYVLCECRDQLLAVMRQAAEFKHYPVLIDYMSLYESCGAVADLLLSNSYRLFPALDEALVRAQRSLISASHPPDDSSSQPPDDSSSRLHSEAVSHTTELSVKVNVHARITDLPGCRELWRTRVPSCTDTGRLVCLTGTVVRVSVPRVLNTRAQYACNHCEHISSVSVDYENCYQPVKPVRCENTENCRAGSGFRLVDNTECQSHSQRQLHLRDYQQVWLQEQVQKLDIGKVPRAICVTLEDDLVDCCQAGDHVFVTGTIMQRWCSSLPASFGSGASSTVPELQLVLKANRVVSATDSRVGLTLSQQRRTQFEQFWRQHRHCPFTGRNTILASFCSQVYGLYAVKLAAALTIIGGHRQTAGSVNVRGEPHLLLVGDPGTGKSQILRYVASVCGRAVLATGGGCTSAGLTCAAVKDGGEWQLEAGALVLADGGVCCIDEFNMVRSTDLVSIHEAMEQQSISVAKAGLVCQLNTRCSVLASANARQSGRMGGVSWGDQTLSSLGLASPLLSRFDLILVLRDAVDSDWDKMVSDYVLQDESTETEMKDSSSTSVCCDDTEPLECNSLQSELDWKCTEVMSSFIVYARSVDTRMTPDASLVLQKYYQLVRGSVLVPASRCTVRLLESLARLCQAHARLRASRLVLVCDAVVAVVLVDLSLASDGGCGVLTTDGDTSHGSVSSVLLYTAFPDNAEQEYLAQCEVVLSRLGLDSLLSAELRRFSSSGRSSPTNQLSNSPDSSSESRFDSFTSNEKNSARSKRRSKRYSSERAKRNDNNPCEITGSCINLSENSGEDGYVCTKSISKPHHHIPSSQDPGGSCVGIESSQSHDLSSTLTSMGASNLTDKQTTVNRSSIQKRRLDSVSQSCPSSDVLSLLSAQSSHRSSTEADLLDVLERAAQTSTPQRNHSTSTRKNVATFSSCLDSDTDLDSVEESEFVCSLSSLAASSVSSSTRKFSISDWDKPGERRNKQQQQQIKQNGGKHESDQEHTVRTMNNKCMGDNTLDCGLKIAPTDDTTEKLTSKPVKTGSGRQSVKQRAHQRLAQFRAPN